jgi:serine/threonine protein kinase
VQAGVVLKGRFRVTRLYAQGGMAQVWMAEDDTDHREVIVKTPRVDPAGAEPAHTPEGRRQRAELAKRFEREIRFLGRLRHPRIPRLLDHGFLAGDRYLVMEHVDGRPLRDFLLDYRPLPLGAAVALAVSIGETIVYAHAQGVIHRDLKPPNVVLRGDGVAFLIDFGIAFPTDPDATRYTAYGATPGSVGYTAPEIMRDPGTVATVAADAYAYGCIVYELLTGEQAFKELPGRSRDLQHLHDEPPRVRDTRPSIPEHVDRLLWALLAKDPGLRPALGEFVDSLRPLLPSPGDPPPASPLTPDPTAPYRDPKGDAIEAARHPLPAPARPIRSHRRQPWPEKEEFARLVEEADAEILACDPGTAAERLAVEIARARTAWGLVDPTVARAQLICADALRIEGARSEAAKLYHDLAEALSRPTAGAGAHELALEARIGIAECLIADRYTDAFDIWEQAVRETVAAQPTPLRAVARCRQVALEFTELGSGAAVARVAALLPPG